MSEPGDSARRRAAVTVTGVVQGVGFRPFVYRTATERDLGGWVKNMGDAGVEIEVEGTPGDVDSFLDALESDPPPLSTVEGVDVEGVPTNGETAFEIKRSEDAGGGSGTIPPDTGICEQCLDDVRDADSRYHDYWGTSCVDCGPRYTVIRELPYDRPRTSMDEFPMCEDCRAAYEDPGNRRYHAQTVACPECGPTLSLLEPDGETVADRTDAIAATGKRLRRGDIVAVRGVGGTHLACDATDPAVVERLRERTGRPAKPFALMAASLDAVESFASVDDTEREALTDVRRPIVLLDSGRPASSDDSRANRVDTGNAGTGDDDRTDWLDAVAPGLHTVGVMLPYSGLHHLLFDHVDGPLVMTSANYPGEPMCIETEAILEKLGDVVDAALVHDREIVARCDDSVARVVDGTRRFVRRSRGWVPQPLPLPADARGVPVLALGGEYGVTVAVVQGDSVVQSQYVGDVDDPSTLSYLRETVDHLTGLTGVDPGTVACDLHPEFLTGELATEYADEGAGPVERVQHHHAHAAALLAERGVERAVVVAADGTGYGPDGTVWGGEVLDATATDYERVGGLSAFRMPGGEAAVERPARLLADLLDDPDRVDELLVERGAVDDASAASVVRQQAAGGYNAPTTTSAGRLLDAVAALLGVGAVRRYQGEPAMRLEAAAAGREPLDYDPPFATRDGARVVDTRALVRDVDALADDHPTGRVAATAQRALATGLADLAVEQARERGVDAVGFTGGVAYNEAITRAVRSRVDEAGLRFLEHEAVPPGDGGLSYGQVVVAASRTAPGDSDARTDD